MFGYSIPDGDVRRAEKNVCLELLLTFTPLSLSVSLQHMLHVRPDKHIYPCLSQPRNGQVLDVIQLCKEFRSL